MFSGGINLKPKNVSAVVDVNVYEKMPKQGKGVDPFQKITNR